MKRIWARLGMVVLLGSLVACTGRNKQDSAAAPQDQHKVAADASEVQKPKVAQGTGVFINGRELSKDDLLSLLAIYHYAPPAGHYWYDTVSGAWGVEGHETIGFILPGHDLGPLAANASAGNTGVFINGREINLVEAAGIQRTFGAVYQGRWWLDGRTGYYGIEGNPAPVGNIITALQAQRSGRNGDNFWSSATARGNSSGGCSYVDVGGTIASSGC